jgi:hypothetical protein
VHHKSILYKEPTRCHFGSIVGSLYNIASCNCEHKTLMCSLLPADFSPTANSQACQLKKPPKISLLLRNKARVHDSCKTADRTTWRRILGKHLWLCDVDGIWSRMFPNAGIRIDSDKLSILLLGLSLFKRYDFCSDMERTFRLEQQRKSLCSLGPVQYNVRRQDSFISLQLCKDFQYTRSSV